MFGDGSGGRLGFFSLGAWFLLLSAEECLRSSNGCLSGEERDMSQARFRGPYYLTDPAAARAGVSRTTAAARAIGGGITIMVACSISLSNRAQGKQDKQHSNNFFHFTVP